MTNIIDFIFQKRIIAPILIFVASMILVKIIKIIVNKVVYKGKDNFEMKKRTTIVELVTNILKGFIYVIAVIMILDVFGVDTKGILASLGIAGVVLGLALQDTVQDLMSGMTIILDNYYVIGDYVRLNNFTGEVVDVSLKSTKVKNINGEIYIFANRNVKDVVNLSQERAGVKIEIPTSYDEPTARVEEVMEKILKEAKKMKEVYADSYYLGIEKFDSSAINYAIIIFCKSTDQWTVRRKMLKLIKDTYDEENMRIPYNQIEVHNGKKI